MLFPRAAVASTAKLPAGAFDGPDGAAGSGAAGAAEDDLAAGGATAEAADVPPRLVT
jgi:hypothetical protein